MDDLKYVRTILRPLTLAERGVIAKRAGVPWSTVNKVVYGITENPGYSTVSKLAATLRKRAKAQS